MGLSSAGIGSGLDVTGLVQQLVSAERAPQANRLQTTKSQINVTLSALGTFKGGLTQLQSAVDALKGAGGALGKATASVSAEGHFTASTTASAVAGRYDVEVLRLAQPHKLASSTFSGGAANVVGEGTVTIGVGDKNFTVTMAAGTNTLADLRDAINKATDNPGVNATLLTEDGGTRLVLTSRETGTAKALTVDTALFSTQQVQAATDAQIRIDGFTHTSGSNTVSGALQGVTLNLTKAEEGKTLSLDIAADNTAASDAIQNLVRAYNAVVAVVKKHASYDTATKTGGALMGDVAVRTSMQQLRGVFGGAHGEGSLTMLSQLGITTATDGTLSVDSAKLTEALSTKREAVTALFSGTGGMASKLSTVLDGHLGTSGRLTAQTDRLQERLDGIADQTAALDRRMAAVEARYRRQFTALDTLVGQMQTTSSYLTQQLANLPGSSKS